MRCFAERSGAKYGRAKCNERTAYTVLCEGYFSVVERRKNKVQRPQSVFFNNFFIPYYFVEEFYHYL